MSAPFVTGRVVPPQVAAYVGSARWRQLLEHLRAEGRRSGLSVPSDAVDVLEALVLDADRVSARQNPQANIERTFVDSACSLRVEWISTKEAATMFETSVRAVQRLCHRGALHAERDGRTYRVCKASALARLEGGSCRH